ncbi:MAG: sugar phosphate isomerase/epimerase [Staphylothermus sp.]|nr:sugar phosphate isomerase/epimerase [Staphylothermus sp.]
MVAKQDVNYVQFSFDLLDPRTLPAAKESMVEQVKDAIKKHGIEIHSTFTGLVGYSFNLFAHPDPLMRMDAMDWYTKAIDLSSMLGVPRTGGHIAAKSANDYSDPLRKQYMDSVLIENMNALRLYAKTKGLKLLLWEPMPVPRETPWTMLEAEEVLKKTNEGDGVPVRLTIDLGHQCTLKGKESDPYEWLYKFAPYSPAIHIQQTDGKADRHWPFTEEYNRIGIIKADKVIKAIDESGASEVYLFLEYIPPAEENDNKVLKNLEESIKYWKEYLG